VANSDVECRISLALAPRVSNCQLLKETYSKLKKPPQICFSARKVRRFEKFLGVFDLTTFTSFKQKTPPSWVLKKTISQKVDIYPKY
jgi:hypothetical protein